MSGRPYFAFSRAELANRITDETSEAELLDIRDELWHRASRPNNLKLIVDITSRLGKIAEKRGEVYDDSNKASNGSRSFATRSSAPSTSAVTLSNVEFESLRRTFTARSEVLARWGVNEQLPVELLNLVFSEWEKVLTDAPDASGRSIARLESDRAKLDSSP